LDRSQWILDYNSQCIVTITQMNWTTDVEKSILSQQPMKALDE